MKIEDIKGKEAEFQYYRDRELWYKIGDFLFPVPIADTGTAVFNAKDKAIFFMRWMRKHKEALEKAKSDN